MNLKHLLIGLLALTLLGLPTTRGSAAAQMATKTYEVTITNITTSKQTISPLLLATHPASAHAWQMGQLASKGLEMVAEDGMPDMLAGELKGVATDIATTHAHLLPGDSITVHITAHQGDVLSAAGMLIQTNDGFTGLDSVALSEGSHDTMGYDAGTEDNTEKATDVPGPPFGGKSDAPDSTPHQPISAHPGITGKADVTPDFNWSGPVARFTIREIAPASTAPGVAAYDVTITNITTSKQTISPLVLATHPASAHAWQMGQLASKGLEMVAEDGMPDMLAGELKGVATDVITTHAHLLPGDFITVRITAHQNDVLSAAGMLIQTNDGFTGLDSVALSDGSHDTMGYDAGTEDNTEKATDVPGPPFGGKSDAPDSTPHQPISAHPGITGKADVTPDFNWSGPVARFTIQAVSTGSVMPGMPTTGATDTTVWWIALLAAVLAGTGLALRRRTALYRH